MGFFLGMSMSYALLWFNPSTILRHYFTNLSVRWGVDVDDADATNAAYAIQATTSICQSVSVDKVINADATDAADAIQATTSI